MAENLYIIGGGQMGTSIARTALEKNAGGNITIFEPHAANRQELEDYLAELGIADQITVTAQHDEELANADIVIMATPIDHFHAVTSEVAPLMKEGAILTDIGSAKVKSVEEIQTALDNADADHIAYIGGHPGVGGAGRGARTSSNTVFENQPVFLIEPDENAAPQDIAAYDRLSNFWDDLGAKTNGIDAYSHDRFLGTTSHFQHAAVFALTLLGQTQENTTDPAYENARTWMRNTTRISRGGNTDMWVPIFSHNTDAILESAANFQNKLESIKTALENEDHEALTALLQQAHDYRTEIADEEREDVSWELRDWSEQHQVSIPDPASTGDLAAVFNHEAQANLAKVTCLPAVLGAALALNAQDVDASISVSITENANPSFKDGTAPVLTDPAYMASLLLATKNQTLQAITQYEQQFTEIVNMIETEDKQGLEETIKRANDIREDMPLPRKPGENFEAIRTAQTSTAHL